MSARVLVLALASALTMGCGFTELHEVVLRKPGPPTSNVEIYLGANLPPRPFYEIALLQAIGHGGDANMEDTMRALENRAITLGCDALVKVRFDRGYSMANAVGVCVRWATTAPAASPSPSPAPSAPVPVPAPSPSAPGPEPAPTSI